MRRFHVLKTLGGCGGTIIARALAANGALVLSEVNPRSAQLFSGALNPIVQMNRDHFMLLPEAWRLIDIHTLGEPKVFGQFMADLTGEISQPLVIRDYSYVDYVGTPFVWPSPNPNLPSLEAALEPFGKIASALLIRHPLDNLRSLLTHPPLATVLTPEVFIDGYISFLEANTNVPWFRYEEFIERPDDIIAGLCAALGVEYNPYWHDGLGETVALTGHRDAKRSVAIQPLTRRIVDDELAERIQQTKGYDYLLELGDYKNSMY